MVRMVGVPHRPDHLRGREADLARLDELLDGNAAAAITPALVGQGGVGKTQLAALYANDRAGRYPDGVFWLTMADPSASNVLGQLVTFARVCGISAEESGDERQDQALAERWLGAFANEPDALLVVDNLEKPDLLTKPLPGLRHHRLRDFRCKRLITSRRDTLPGCAPVRLSCLSLTDARRGPDRGRWA